MKRAAQQLSDWCRKDYLVELIVESGAVEAILRLLNCDCQLKRDPLSSADVEKDICIVLGLLGLKPQYRHVVACRPTLTGVVRLLRAHQQGCLKLATASCSVARRAADAITNLAHDSKKVKTLVRQVNGIEPLVTLLDAWDVRVQRAAAGALRTIAFKDELNKTQIVKLEAIPKLVQMLRSEDFGVLCEAIGVIGNLVHSCPDNKRKVLDEGALQPIINLLAHSCPDTQREAALLLGQFATADDSTKGKIAQRGAVPLLVGMLAATDVPLKEMAAFALGRLAQSSDNQAGIVQCGGLRPLLDLLEAKNCQLQHMAAFALYGIADSQDNIPAIISEGGLQQLVTSAERVSVTASKECIKKTISRIEAKLKQRQVLSQVLYLLRSSNPRVQLAAALALARLAPDDELCAAFVHLHGLDVLGRALQDPTCDPDVYESAAGALLLVAKRASELSPAEGPQQQLCKSVYLGAQFVNCPTLSDVTFMVEGRPLYAHRIALLASSDAFRAMFDGCYRERDVQCINIPNMRYAVMEAMMMYVYTGRVDLQPDLAWGLLQAADQYLLEGLKQLCESCIADSLSTASLAEVLGLSDTHGAPQLAKRCVLFVLQHIGEFARRLGRAHCAEFMGRILPLMQPLLCKELSDIVPLGKAEPMETDVVDSAAGNMCNFAPQHGGPRRTPQFVPRRF